MKKLIKAMKEKKDKGDKPSSIKDKRALSFSKKKTRKIASILVFGVMGISLLFNVIHFTKVQSIRNTVQASYNEIDEQMKGVEKGSLIESQRLVVYGDEFVRKYINLPAEEEGREQRTDDLKGYFVAGFDVNNLEDTSEFIGSRTTKSITFLDMERRSSHEAVVFYRIAYDITQVKEVEKEVKKTKGKGKDKKEVIEKVKENQDHVTNHQVEMAVPVITDGEGFAVTNNPSLTSSNVKSSIQHEVTELDGEEVTSKEIGAFNPFLTDFFTSFGISDEKLAFMGDLNKGLTNKVYEEHKISEAVKNHDIYTVRVNVTFREQETALSNRYFYELTIHEENGRLFVQSIH
ncbi:MULTISPECIES: conjugal transfer protein [Cytobacillus]|uniref:Conjugal transfer protein n=1 Tax=Cytobacillus kochii TaxID=859143 RepID=A0A248TPM1_9BACI|nr:conjugal transfer protein [Cytobacillus kochii]ASV70147.1 conjugal transfer protein [Cytobacillus kochii]MDQ0186694.1 hypothetical protein [Cytobacillus kochii]